MHTLPQKEQLQNLKEKYIEKRLDTLADLEPVDKIEWLPLAPGWWALIIISSLLMLQALVGYIRWLLYRMTYKSKVFDELCLMQNALKPHNSYEIARKLSEILRRLSLHQNIRKDCAGLEGLAWLKWLSTNDKNHFDWEKNGQILVEDIYANPKTHTLPIHEVKQLINATKKWVEK